MLFARLPKLYSRTQHYPGSLDPMLEVLHDCMRGSCCSIDPVLSRRRVLFHPVHKPSKHLTQASGKGGLHRAPVQLLLGWTKRRVEPGPRVTTRSKLQFRHNA